MNASAHAEVKVPEPLTELTVSSRDEPICRQRHNENSRGANDSADHYHSISRKFLRQRAYDRHEEDDHDSVDRGKLSDRSVRAEFANAELWKDVIHLQKDRLEKSDEDKEQQQPVKSGLPNQSSKKMRGIDRASAHCFPNTAQEIPGGVSTARYLINHRTAVCCFRATPQKVNHGKQHNLENKTDDEQLLIAAGLKSEETDVEVELADVVENPARGDVADVHYHVDDRERDRPLRDRGVAPRCR